VSWVERGRFGEGNSVPRYHVVWGTSRELTRRMVAALREEGSGGRLELLHGQRVVGIERVDGRVSGVEIEAEADGARRRIQAPVVVLAMGGINGSLQQAVANW